MTRFLLTIVAVSTIFFTACQKEVSEDLSGAAETAAKLKGDWRFIHVEGQSTNTIIITDGVDEARLIGIADFVTLDNTGTMKVDDSKMVNTNLGYRIDATIYAKYYENGSLEDEYEDALQETMPPTSGSSNYVVVSADSISFPGSGPTPQQDGGARIRFEGNRLYLTTGYEQTEEEKDSPIPGATTTTTIKVVLTAVYEKQ